MYVDAKLYAANQLVMCCFIAAPSNPRAFNTLADIYDFKGDTEKHLEV